MAEICITVFSKVIEKPIDLLWNLIYSPVTAVFSCKSNVENLKKEAVELKNKLQSVEEYEQLVERRGEEMGNDLKTWLTYTKQLISETDRVFAVDEVDAKNKCFFGVCFNPVSRYKLSKNAVHNSVSIAQQLIDANRFKIPDFYVPAPVVETASAVEGFEDFGSRREVLEQIMEELQSTRVRKVALYGMAGAGKTTLVKEIKRKVEEEKLFDKVVFASVTNNPDLKRIQKEIAFGLGMDLLPAELEVRNIAFRINAKLRKMKRVLVIFDDVWTKLNLEELGVAFDELNSDGHGGEGMKSKNLSSSGTGSSGKECVNWIILFTSRDLNVLKTEMGSQTEFEIGKLAEFEAWQMFKKIAGERFESDHDLQSVANGIVKECDGLPLAISALANALKDKKLHEWRSALTRLQKPSPYNFTGMCNSVYAAIEVSYNQLGTEQLKQILLLSSMLGKIIFIQDLLKYSVGLGLFQQVTTIEDARDELLTLISNLKAASLFIDGSDDEFFVMHDLIRDVAISIAHRDRHGLLLEDKNVPKEWSDMEAVKYFKWICLNDANINGLPNELDSSQLSFFYISTNDSRFEIPSDFFKGMQRLKVLDLTAMHMASVPSSIRLLNNLHTLCLDQSFLGDISIIGELQSLKILSFLDSDMEELPGEIRKLTRLQLLDMSGCYKLTVVPPHVLENLSKLEELYLANSFDKWELEERRNQRNASLVELEHLKSLVTLEVRIGDVEMIPRDLIFRDLTRYKIFIGDEFDNWESSFHSSKIIRLKLQKDRALNNLYNSVKKLPFKNTVELHLEGLIGVRNLVDELDENGFQDLKYLFVQDSPDVEKTISSANNAFPNLEVLFLHQLIKLEKICHGRFTETSFLKLREIGVSCCDQLKNLFSSAVAKHLLGLQEIRVTECKNMEEILDDKQQAGSVAEIVDITERAGKLEFGKQLRVLLLKHLPKLSSLSSSGSISLFNDQVISPNLMELQLSWIDVSVIWETSVITSTCVENLTKLIIEGCHNLKYIFTSTMTKGLSKLAHLEIKECRRMREVVLTEIAEEGKNLIFPKLSFLFMEDLQSLVGFYSGSCIVEFPSLKQLGILNCPKLKGFCVEAINSGGGDDIDHALFNDRVAFPVLQFIVLSSLASLKNIWTSQLDADSFRQIDHLTVHSCEKLLNVFPSSMMERLINMSKLEIWSCDLLEGIFDMPQTQQGLIPGPDQIVPNKIAFPMLLHLDLCMLPKLKWFFPKEYTLECPMLTKLEVAKCDLVQILASECSSFHRENEDNQQEIKIQCPLFWVDKATFSSLEELNLEKNFLMKEIWHGEHQADYLNKEDNIAFTNLKYCLLSNMPVLASFSSSNCNFKFPSLEDLTVMGCPRMQHFSQGELLTPKLQSVKWTMNEDHKLWKDDLNSTIRELFSQKVGYSTLEDLKLVEFPELISIWNKTPQDTISVRMLKRLEVCNINNLSYLFTPTMALELVQLEVLKVTHCDTMEVVIIEDGFQEIIFPKLKELWLIQLPKLTRFCSKNYLKFPCLWLIFIESCPLLKTFISSSENNKDSNMPALFDAKVALPKLERLIIDSMRSLNKIWEDQLEADAFCILNYLRVESCEKLLNIFSYGMLKRLQKLDQLRVRNCSSVEEIFEYKGASEPHAQSTTVVDAMDFILKFPNLTHLEFYMLPKLKCVSTRVRTIECPLLKLLQVNGCDEVKIFASEYPSFQIPTGDDEQEISPQCPLFWVTKGTFPSLTALKLEWNSNMKDLWCGKDPGSYFPKLMHIELIDFPEQSAQLASFFVQSLPEFCELVVNGVSREISQENKASSSQQVHEIQWDQWD